MQAQPYRVTPQGLTIYEQLQRFSFIPDDGEEVFFGAATVREAQEIAIDRWHGISGIILDHQPWLL